MHIYIYIIYIYIHTHTCVCIHIYIYICIIALDVLPKFRCSAGKRLRTPWVKIAMGSGSHPHLLLILTPTLL